MTKKLLLFCAMTVVSFTTFAGGLLTNTNQHIAYLRSLARQSSTEIDAIYYNPAGTAFFKEGWNFSFNGQSAFQTRTITSDFAPFAGNVENLGQSTKSYKGNAAAPFMPSVFGAYKRENWTFSVAFNLIGGGGKATFNEGLPSFEAGVSMLPALAASKLGLAGVDKYGFDSYMHGKQYIYGFQMGAAYEINDNWGVFGGVRMNYVDNEYNGYIRNITANLQGGDKMIPVHAALSQMASKNPGLEAYLPMVADKNVDVSQSGWGVTPIIGVHFRSGKWDAAMKFEMRTNLNVENKIKQDDTGVFKAKGSSIDHDLPSILTFGTTYRILPTLRASVGYNHYFDKGARMDGGRQKHIKQGTNEYLGGLEWDICEWAQISGGIQRTKYGVTPAYQSDLSFSLSSYSFGFGAGFRLAENVKLNVAYFWTNYDNDHKSDRIGGLVPISYEFNRTNKVFGAGIDFSF